MPTLILDPVEDTYGFGGEIHPPTNTVAEVLSDGTDDTYICSYHPVPDRAEGPFMPCGIDPDLYVITAVRAKFRVMADDAELCAAVIGLDFGVPPEISGGVAPLNWEEYTSFGSPPEEGWTPEYVDSAIWAVELSGDPYEGPVMAYCSDVWLEVDYAAIAPPAGGHRATAILF